MRNTGKRVTKPRNTRHFGLALETLESRCMLAAQPIASVLHEPSDYSSAPALAAAAVSPAASVSTTVSITVSGTAKWTDPGGGTHAIPLAYVEIRSSTEADTDPALATCQTDVNGNFSAVLNFDTSSGAQVFARIFARNPAADVKPDTGSAATTYYMNTQSSAVTAAGPITLPEKDASNSVVAEESFSILGATLQAQSYATLLAGGGTAPSQLDVRFPSNTAANGTTASFFNPSTKQLFITQRRVDDWDVIEHEYGHYVADKYGFFSAVGGSHNFGTATPKPNGAGLAWNEGWADFFSISAQLNEPSPYANGVPNEGDTSYNPAGPPAGTNPNYNLATGTGVGELDEASVSSVLYHLTVGDEGITVKDTTLFTDLVSSKASTFGAAYDAIAASMSGAQRSLLGHVLGLQNIAPIETAPAAGGSTTTSSIPTFTWTDADPAGTDDFILQFYTSDYKTLIYQTPDLGDVYTYTPDAAAWSTIFDGHSTVKWFVEGEDTTAPVTPGGVPDMTYPGQTLDRYWSGAGILNGPSIGIVLDVTGSMEPEINSVQAALVQYITNLQNSLSPGETPPTIDLVTFRDYPMETISSNDLDAVKAAIQEQVAEGGGDIPEPSAQSLEFAANNIGPGGTLLLITDAPSDAGTDLDGTIAQLRANGDTVNAVISGDYAYDDEPTGPGGDAIAAVMHSSSMVAATSSAPASVTKAAAVSSTAVSMPAIAPADSLADSDGPEPPQGPVTDAGQLPTSDAGNTVATATPLGVDGPIVHAFIGNQVQGPTGSAVTDTDNYYSFNLVAGTSYNIPVLTDGYANVDATLYGTDGTTTVASGGTIIGDPGFGYLTLTYVPTVSGTYYLDINQPTSPTGYTIQVSDNPLVGATSSVVLWTTVAGATGGEFLYKPAIVYDSSDPSVTTDYQAAIVNVMDSTFEPTVLSVSPNKVPAGTTLDVTLTGAKTNWIQGNSTVAFSVPGITVDSVTVNSPTSITAAITVAPGATPNFSNVTVTTALGSATETAVGSNALQISAAPTSPTLLEVDPGTLARGGTYNVQITGTLTSWDATSTVSLGPGVTVSGVTVVSPTEIIANVEVSASASIGFRVATVTTADTGATDTQDMAITLTAAPVTAIATVASITPNQAQDGQHASIAVVGESTNFVAGETTADFGPGVTVDSVSVTDATHATVTIDVSTSATAGFRNVTLTTGTETATLLDGFQVTPPSQQPTNLSTVTATGEYGGTATLTATLTSGLTSGGPALPGKIVTFTLNNGGTVTSVGMATTDQNGIATLTGVSLTGFGAGTYSGAITATFAADASDLGSSASGDLTVTTAPLSVVAANQTMVYGSVLPTLSGTLTGVVNGDNITASFGTTATSSSDAGTYPIVATLNDPNGRLSNYTVTNTPGTLTITQATPMVTLTASVPVVATGQPVTFTATVSGPASAAAQPTGSVQFELNGQNYGSPVTLSPNGTADQTFSWTTAANESVTAVYLGDRNYQTGPSPTVTEPVLAPGAYAMGTTLVVLGANTTDAIAIVPLGRRLDGSTGLGVVGTLNGRLVAASFVQAFTTIEVFGYGGNDGIGLAPTLTLATTIVEGGGNDTVVAGAGNTAIALGKGNDFVLMGNGNDTVTAGDGNVTIVGGNGSDSVTLGNGADSITLGNGNDTVSAGDGADTVTLGNGNDTTSLGNGSDVIVEGNGNDNVSAGNGPDLVVGGLGQHTIQLGNGNDILIDGSATVVKHGDSLRQILSDWNASKSASVNTRLKVVYNTTRPNVLNAGSGRDWFFFTNSKDVTNKKSTDRLN